MSYILPGGRITAVTRREDHSFRRATAGDDDLRTVSLLDHHHAARPGRGRGEYHKVRTNLTRYGMRMTEVLAISIP